MKHSKWGLRLNHDVTTSDRLLLTLKFLKFDPGGGIRLRAKGGAIYLFTGCLGAKTLYIYMIYGFVKHFKWGLRLSTSTMMYLQQIGWSPP